MTWTDHAVVLLGAALIIWLSARGISSVARPYPLPEFEEIRDCGFYAMTQLPFGGVVKIGVSHNGLALRQAIIPWIFHAQAFVPWEDTWIREDGDRVVIGVSKVSNFEMRLNKVVVATMQHRLGSKVPFGHVDH